MITFDSAGIAQLADGELHDLVKLTFFWGMHSSGMYQQRYVFTQLKSHPNYVGVNRLKWDRAPRSVADRSVSTPNASTLYGFGQYDLRQEPIVVATPAVPDRYFSVQASDQFPRWFFQVGKQFTGSGAQQHLIVGPDFRGPYPPDFAAAQVWGSPSNFAVIAVRYALTDDSAEELAKVNALMDATTVAPLSVWLANDRRPVRAEDQPLVPGDYATFERMPELVEIATALTGVDLLQLVSLVLNDPTMTLRTDSAKEVAALERIAKLGLAPGVTFDPDWLSPAQKEVVEAAFAEAKKESTHRVMTGMINRNGWQSSNELLEDINDYVRQGFYGLTTIGAPIPKRSHAGAFGFVDSEGRPMTGVNRYTMTFRLNDMPPVSEFWELPIYDENGYFCDNPLHRYSITSFMLDRGELHTADGKLVIHIQKDEPADPDARRNWLPAPDGLFRFAFRFYGPKGALIDWTYDMPGVVRAD
jgi:hypothetical protein